MPFQVSPGVNVTEIDLTTIVPAVSSTEGAIAGVFRWGPIEERVLVTSEDDLVVLQKNHLTQTLEDKFWRTTREQSKRILLLLDCMMMGCLRKYK